MDREGARIRRVLGAQVVEPEQLASICSGSIQLGMLPCACQLESAVNGAACCLAALR